MSAERLGVRGAVVNGAYVPGDLEVVDGIVTRCGLPAGPRGHAVPGLVDLQVNGYGGADFNEADTEGCALALAALARVGVLAVQPTLITDAPENTVRQLRVLGSLPLAAPGRATVVGIHAEGPFLNPNHRGVHRAEFLRAPDRELVERFLAAGPLLTMTVAPELDGALELISWAARQGLAVQAGHSGATAEQAHQAFDAGARAVTHLFNGMVGLGHRAPGIAGAALARPDVAVQLIADGVHLAPETAHFVLRAAELRSMLVTDASSAAGAGNGRTTLGGWDLVVRDGVPRLADGTLAGSTVPLVRQVASLVESGWPLDRAVNLASLHPARYLCLADAGVIRIGGPADLLVLDEDLTLSRVLQAGTDVALA
jgi:N-acetylglucosamine-6-phosphate deacetylase